MCWIYASVSGLYYNKYYATCTISFLLQLLYHDVGQNEFYLSYFPLQRIEKSKKKNLILKLSLSEFYRFLHAKQKLFYYSTILLSENIRLSINSN